MPAAPKFACEVHAKVLKTRAKIRQAIKDGKLKIEKIITTIGIVLWGIADASLADIITFIGNVSTNIAASLAASLSAMIAAGIQQILQNLLMILINSIDGIYALAKFPHDKLVDDLANERDQIGKISMKLGIITSIVEKWIKKTASIDYEMIMRKAMIPTQKAFDLLEDVIVGLDNEVNSTFDTGKYSQAIGLISDAIDITAPDTIINRMFNPIGSIEDVANEIFIKKSTEIKATYKNLRDKSADKYQKRVLEYNGSTPNIVAENEKMKHRNRVKMYDIDERMHLDKARTDATFEATQKYIGGGFGSTALSISDEFTSDMTVLQEMLAFLPEDIRLAYMYNKSTQALSNTLYNFKNSVLKLVEFLIALIQKMGNNAGTGASRVLKASQSYVGLAGSILEDNIDKFDEVATERPMQTELASQLLIARASLIAADTMMGATMVSALMDLINLDDKMSKESEEYKVYAESIARIRDWDGKEYVWAVNPLMGSLNPYVKLTSKIGVVAATSAAAIVPGARSSNRLEKLRKSTGEMYKVLGSISKHNSEVMSVITSWEPPYSPFIEDLKESLSRMGGALNIFSYGLALSSVLTSLGVSLEDMDLDYIPCEEAYPDLYDSPEVQLLLSEDKSDFPTIAEINPAGLQIDLGTLNTRVNDYAMSTKDAVVINPEDLASSIV